MKYTLTNNAGFSFATIVAPRSKTSVAYISVDIHQEQTAHIRATELLYTDALISGAGKYTRAEFLDAINTLGASLTVVISDGILTFLVRCRSEVLKKVMTLFETMISDPHFDAKELKRIKQTVTNALKESKENTRAIAHEQLRNTLYGQHDRRYTYAEDTLISAIAEITPKDLHTLHNKICGLYWTCSTASAKEFIEVTRKQMASIKSRLKTTEGRFGIHQQKPPQPILTLKEVPSKQNIDFCIGVPVPITLHHPDYLPLRFALTVLGGPNFSSRLMSTVREAEGLTYDIQANVETFASEEQGYWRVATFFSPEKSLKGLTSTFREIKKLYEHGITKEELERYKIIHHTKQALLGDGTARQINDLHAYHVQQFSLEEIAEFKRRTLSLTLVEVNDAIRHYLNPAELTISGAGPVSAVKKQLQAFIKTVA